MTIKPPAPPGRSIMTRIEAMDKPVVIVSQNPIDAKAYFTEGKWYVIISGINPRATDCLPEELLKEIADIAVRKAIAEDDD